MSTVISLTGTENPLKVQFFPPLEGSWELGLLSLHSRNIVPNITMANNMFYYGKGDQIEVPPGHYNLDQLTHSINNQLMSKHGEDYVKLTNAQRQLLGYSLIKISWNPLLQRVEFFCAFQVRAHGDHSVVAALGFESDVLMAMRVNIAEREMRFYKDNIIKVKCSDVVGSFENGVRGKTIYEFDCHAPAGERYVEKPNIVTYFPVCDKSSLRELHILLADRLSRPLNLIHELTLVRLHLRDATRI